MRAVGGELVYRLPLPEIAHFPNLLEALEAQGEVRIHNPQCLQP